MRPFLVILFVSACGLAIAQAPVYRSTMPDGKKIISERPMPGAVKVEELKVSPSNVAPGNPVPKSTATGVDRSATLDAARAELRKAQDEYDAAVAKAAKGVEELPGDRQGTAKGGSRYTDDFEKRQASLKAGVDAAQARLNAARTKVNDAR
jgi:hypothetical protein